MGPGDHLSRAARPTMAGQIVTVLGLIDPGQLGFTLSHEHIFIDLRRTHLPYRTWVVRDDHIVADPPGEDFPGSEMALWESKLDLSNVHLARAVAPIADNYVLGDEELAVRELMAFKNLGGGAVMDVTSIGLKRDPLALRRISERTGLHIVMGTGYYQRVYHPDNMDALTAAELTDIIVRDVNEGVHDGRTWTDVRAGIIGEIGINGGPLITNELKSMRAAARASRLTGAPVLIHLGGIGAEKHTILDIVEDEGVDLNHVVLGHCDDIARDTAFTLELLARGVYVAFDNLGREPAVAKTSLTAEVADSIPNYLDAGYEDRILLSHDICWKTSLKAYAGLGYTFIQEYFLPRLRELGASEVQVDKMMVENPARVLPFVEPRE